jgi:intracellular multiplication protein IcmE
LQQQANQQDLERAQANNKSSLPSLIGNQGLGDPLTLPDLPSSAGTAAPSGPAPTLALPNVAPPVPVAQPLRPVEAAPAPVVVAQAPAQQMAPSDEMSRQILGYMSLWGPRDNQMQEYPYARTSKGTRAGADGDRSAPGAADTARPSGVGQNSSKQSIRFVRAGSVVPARMMTPLTSDNPGPVLAEISTGPLAGARLIGTMSTQEKGLLVRFNTITKPGWPDTYSINAVGLTNDGYTGMATDVNNHYLKRYTALLAGTFMSGYGQALGQQGSTTIITDGGAVVTQQDDLDTQQIRNAGYGSVAQAVGQEIAQSSNIKPTIVLKGKDGQQYEFQILFLTGF